MCLQSYYRLINQYIIIYQKYDINGSEVKTSLWTRDVRTNLVQTGHRVVRLSSGSSYGHLCLDVLQESWHCPKHRNSHIPPNLSLLICSLISKMEQLFIQLPEGVIVILIPFSFSDSHWLEFSRSHSINKTIFSTYFLSI